MDAKRAAKLTPIQAAVYDIVLDLVYEGAGSTPCDYEYFACHLGGVTASDVAAAVDHLVGINKLIKTGSELTNKRAKREAKSRQELKKKRKKAGQSGGRRSGETRSNPLKSNDDQGKQNRSKCSDKKLAEKKRKEEMRRELDPNGSNAGAPPPAPPGAPIDLLGDPIKDDDEKAPLPADMLLPEKWRLDAMQDGRMTAEEADLEWRIGFLGYWPQRKGLKDGKKSRSNWYRTWLNYCTGDICQKRLQSRRRSGGYGGKADPAGVLGDLRDAVAEAAKRDVEDKASN